MGSGWSRRHPPTACAERFLFREKEMYSSWDGKGMGGLGDKAGPPGLAHQPVFFVCLFRNVPVQKRFTSKLSLGPMIMLITPRSGWGSHPDENWESPAKAQLFPNSQGIRVIDGSFCLFIQMFCCLGDKASSARL